MSDNIPPFDLQVEIMKRLPVKSLLQFRSVSKPWRSCIDSSKFIANYHRGTQQHHLLVSYTDPENVSQQKFVSIVDDDTFPKQKFSLIVPSSVKSQIFVGSSQGLFCFYEFFTETAVIWNPSIRKSVSISLSLPVLGGSPYLCDDTVVAFGVCPDTCDPKLVKLTHNDSFGEVDTVVQVFSLRAKAWKRLTTNLPRKSIRFTKNQAVIDRFIYWLALDTNGYVQIIISFDMITEEFKELYLPDTLALDSESSELFISKMRDSLVVVQIRDEDEKSVASVWMMDDNDPKLFTKQFIIKTPNEINVVRGFRRNGEPIIDMVAEDDPNNVDLFVYESDSEHINRIGITVVPQLLTNVSSYMETLLLLDH